MCGASLSVPAPKRHFASAGSEVHGEPMEGITAGMPGCLVEGDNRGVGELPEGSITMLFSDIEGSTALLSRLDGRPTYLTDSTLEQLHDSAAFDAYRELGACSVKLAMQEACLVAAVGNAVADVVGTR